ncbi:MAG: hypothetical protein GY943_00540 [Chloroflexi bacterium]|nr:hypothetical protein [Chloroflexota bacterium]
MKTQSSKQGLVWGSLLILFGIVGLIEMVTDLTAWVWVAILAVAGLGTFGTYLANRSEWWLLIPTYVMWAVATLVALIQLGILRGEFIAPFVLTAVALPFLFGYLRNREQWGLLIPAYVLLAVGVMVFLIGRGVLNDLLIPAYIMFTIAIPFFIVFGRNSQHWWALIPGGIMTVIGLAFLITTAIAGYVIPIVLILAGIWVLVRQRVQGESPSDKLKSG